MSQILNFNLDGMETQVLINGDDTLLKVLRDKLHKTSPKCGCNHGDCGACTVHLDGKAVKSCTVLAASVEGRKVVTLEGLTKGDDLHPIQQAFIDFNAPQCGYCTPGMVMASVAFLNSSEKPNEEEVREAISGNLCRCTGYKLYIDAIMAVVDGKYGELPKGSV